MKITLIVLGLYLLYFVAMMLYDAFIYKPKVKTNDDSAPVMVMEGQEDLVDETTNDAEEDLGVKNVSLENVEVFDTKEFLDDDEIQPQSLDEEEIQINAKSKMEQEQYSNFDEEESDDSRFNNITVSDFDSHSENISEYAFLAQFQKSLMVQKPESEIIQDIIDDEDVFDIIQEPDLVTSFQHGQLQMSF